MRRREEFVHRFQLMCRVVVRGEQYAGQPPVSLGNQTSFLQRTGSQHLETFAFQGIEQLCQLLAGDVAAIDIGIDDQNGEMQMLEHADSLGAQVVSVVRRGDPGKSVTADCRAIFRRGQCYAARLSSSYDGQLERETACELGFATALY